MTVRIRKVVGSIPIRSTILRRRLWISHSDAKSWVTPVNRGGDPLFCALFQSFEFSSRNRMHQFWNRIKKDNFSGVSTAPLLIRIFFYAPIFSKVIRIISAIEKPPHKKSLSQANNILLLMQSGHYLAEPLIFSYLETGGLGLCGRLSPLRYSGRCSYFRL